MKRLSILLFLLGSFSLNAVEETTALSMYKEEEKFLKKMSVIGTMFPIPGLSTVFQAPFLWTKYHRFKKVRKIFSAAEVLSNQSQFSKKKIQKSTTRMENFLKRIKKESQVNASYPTMFDFLAEDQKKLDKRINDLSLCKLTNLLDQANRLIPASIGDKRLKYLACSNLEDFCSVFICASYSGGGTSILEAQLSGF